MSIFNWFKSFWDKLSDKTKKQIINTIVESFTIIFKAFYETNKKGAQNDKFK